MSFQKAGWYFKGINGIKGGQGQLSEIAKALPLSLSLSGSELMTKKNLIIFAVIIVVISAIIYYSYYNKENFDDVEIASTNSITSEHNEKPVLVLFYADWCGACKALKPTWKKLVEKYKSSSVISFKKVECDKNPEVAKEHNIEGYPTIILFKNGKKIIFEGNRTLKNLENFIN